MACEAYRQSTENLKSYMRHQWSLVGGWLARSGKWDDKNSRQAIHGSPAVFCSRNMLTNIFMCNKIITHETLLFERRTKMGNIAVIMPVIGAIGFIIIVAVILVIRSKEKRERIKSVDAAAFNSFAEEMKRENAEMKKDLQTVKEKVEAIDKMMKDI